MKGLESLRNFVYGIINPLTDWLVRIKAHPNLLTTIGFLVTMSSALFYHQDHVRTAGFMILLGGFFDILDGRVARLSGLGSKFGAFYDSTLDRISEVAVFMGMLSLYNDQRHTLSDVGMIYLIMLAMAGSLMVSYTRSRAETMGIDCKVGLMPRAERVVLIGASSLFFGMMWNGFVLKAVIFILAVTTNLTAIQRIYWVWKHARGVPIEEPSSGVSEPQEITTR